MVAKRLADQRSQLVHGVNNETRREDIMENIRAELKIESDIVVEGRRDSRTSSTSVTMAEAVC